MFALKSTCQFLGLMLLVVINSDIDMTLYSQTDVNTQVITHSHSV